MAVAKGLLLASAMFATLAGGGDGADDVTTLVAGELAVCVYAGFPPLVMKNEAGMLVGADMAFLAGFASSLGLRMVPVLQEQFDGIWLRPANDECDIAGTGIAGTPDRADRHTEFSMPYFATERAFAVRASDRHLLERPEDLSGQIVLVVEGSTAHRDLERRIDDAGVGQVRLAFTHGDATAIERIKDWNAFAYAGDRISIEYLARQDPAVAMAWPHTLLKEDGGFEIEEFVYVVRKANTGLVEALDRYIRPRKQAYRAVLLAH